MSKKATPTEQANESPDRRQLALPWWDGWLSGAGGGQPRQSPRSPGDHAKGKPGKGHP